MDGIRDRKNDLTYQDVTPYDEKVANIVSDYFNCASELGKLVNEAIDAIEDTEKEKDYEKNLEVSIIQKQKVAIVMEN